MGTAREHMSLGFPAAGPTRELICQNVSDFLAPFVTFFYDCLSQYSIAKPLRWPNRMGCSSVVRDLGQAQLVLIAEFCDRHPSTKIVFSTRDYSLGGKDKYFGICSQGTSQQDSSA